MGDMNVCEGYLHDWRNLTHFTTPSYARAFVWGLDFLQLGFTQLSIQLLFNGSTSFSSYILVKI